ncbi:MAG TPA: hypothetical protein PLC52_00570 [Anaerolineales bacterium]|nr:hypothetical protein [Anaerolineales bacterium]HRQ91347.1 hypothetical protein [Anaerolineales bacterium]
MNGLRVTRHSLFLAFIAMGLVCGLLIGSLGSALAASENAKTPATENTVVVLVNQLSAAEPQVQSVWAVQRSVPGAYEWTPLYAAPLEQAEYPLVLASLSMDAIMQLVPVQQSGMQFSAYFVLDQVAAKSLLALMGTTPETGLLQQAQAIEQACALPWQAEHLDVWVALMPEHLQSSVSVFELITRWDAWAQGGFTLQCTLAWAG